MSRDDKCMDQNFSVQLPIEKQIEALEPILEQLKKATTTPQDKLSILNELPAVRDFMASSSLCQSMLRHRSEEGEIAIKSILAIGQGPIIFQRLDEAGDLQKALKMLMETLIDVERFYDTIGGVIGYHLTVLKLIAHKGAPEQKDKDLQFLHPEGLDLSALNHEVHKAIRWGIEHLPIMAEIYPVGGAGDRLMLTDEQTGKPLPAAQLQFGGRTLLENLIRDLQGREYLYHKLYGKQLMTPVAMMTSHEKDNHRHILAICSEQRWFGRPQENFFFFPQPLVPVITKEGDWAVSAPLRLILKPGGHGIMWKLAHQEKIFDSLKEKGSQKALVRQINNPVAGIDHGLLALMGIGCKKNKAFGFASCPRILKAPEGMNVLLEKEEEGAYHYCLTNIEYTDFEQKGIQDVAVEPGSPYSAFPSNTNILFADLEAVEAAAEDCPIPGMLINMKTKTPCLDRNGCMHEVEAGRLESTMQNIADYIVDTLPYRLTGGKFDQLKSFITFNERRKTISVTKSSYQEGNDLLGSPEGCLYEMMQNHEELLSRFCKMKIPANKSPDHFIKEGPPFVFWYHPALGPLFYVIGQKIRGGSLATGSELQLEIAELELVDVNIRGSLLIMAEQVMGCIDAEGHIKLGNLNGKCRLKNVTVHNAGIDRSGSNIYWKNQLQRQEKMHILLHGNAEFTAEDVLFEGEVQIEVPDGHKMTAAMDGQGKVTYRLDKIERPTWFWRYSFDDDDQIQLKIHK